MGISKNQLKISSDKLAAFTVEQVGEVSAELDIVKNGIQDINIAQKTVNTRGTKELLSQEYSYNLTPASTNGTGTLTFLNQTVTLKESILNYETIAIQLKVNTSTVKVAYPTYSLKTSSIVFNNSNTLNFADGSTISINKVQGTVSAGAWGSAASTVSIWFKDENHLFIYNAGTPYTDSGWANMVLSSVQGVNIQNVTIDPVNYVNTIQGIEDTPVGNIISMMGKTAPKHYLICDGSIHNIADYPYLSQYFKDQFGTYNVYGGNGTTTFAVPDTRDEFIRGYHGDKTEKLSGEPGIHQEPTYHLGFNSYGGTTRLLQSRGIDANTTVADSNYDKVVRGTNWRNYNQSSVGTDTGGVSTYASRPTNVAVLFCIKYEPTYFMNLSGVLEIVNLWEGNVGTNGATRVTDSITLLNSYVNYDMLGFYFNYDANNGIRPQYKEIPTDQISQMINSAVVNTAISLNWGYSNIIDYTDILKTSTTTKFDLAHIQSFLTKVVGIKYKTNQSADIPYSNDEIREMVEGVYNGN